MGAALGEPATLVRHYEDATPIIIATSAAKLPPLADHGNVRALAGEMLAQEHRTAGAP